MNLKSQLWQESPILFYSLLEDSYDKFVENLFNYSSIINTPNTYGETLLHYCCFHGIIDKYYALINIGAQIKETKNKSNLLHYACINGKDDFLIVELIKSGINPVEKNILGHTCLHYAENEKICHYLNLWCLRNNISVQGIIDNDLNSLIDTSKILGHKKSLHYWKTNYPNMKTKENAQNLYVNKNLLCLYPI